MGKIFRKLKTGGTVIPNLSLIRSKFRIGGIEGTPGKEKKEQAKGVHKARPGVRLGKQRAQQCGGRRGKSGDGRSAAVSGSEEAVAALAFGADVKGRVGGEEGAHVADVFFQFLFLVDEGASHKTVTVKTNGTPPKAELSIEGKGIPENK